MCILTSARTGLTCVRPGLLGASSCTLKSLAGDSELTSSSAAYAKSEAMQVIAHGLQGCFALSTLCLAGFQVKQQRHTSTHAPREKSEQKAQATFCDSLDLLKGIPWWRAEAACPGGPSGHQRLDCSRSALCGYNRFTRDLPAAENS